MIAALPILAAAAAVAASPAAKPATFDMTVGGVAYATEEYVRAESAEGLSLTGKVALKIPGGGDATLSQQAKLTREGRPISYTLSVDAPGQQASLNLRPGTGGFTMSVTPKGAAQPAESKDVTAEGAVFLLDNNFASHLDVLTRTLGTLAPATDRAITTVVPQILRALPGTLRRGTDGQGTLDGAPVVTRSYRLVVANVVTELIARADDGMLLEADVPSQAAVLKRRGYEGPAGGDAAAAPARPAAAADPRETPLDLVSSAGPLPATLTMPKSNKPVPAVLFLSGSGPNDRDETIGPNKPFADIARGLADRGIASLRFDKRTHAVKDKSKLEKVQLADEYYDDAKAAIAKLGATPGVYRARLFVLGHSEGAMVAPKVAAEAAGLRGVVMMAPGVRPIDEMIIDQMATGAKESGQSPEEIAEQTRSLQATFAKIKDAKRLDTPPFMGAPAAYWRELIALDVAKLVKDSTLPILVLQGDEDIQVRKDADFELLRSRVGPANGRVTYKSFAGLNHLFMHVEHGSTGAEYGLPGHVDLPVISAIADWILQH
jgi:alpha-beta hydrolase superfamily lysophospholipase